MTENLNKKPPKGILKSSSSFDTASCAGPNAARRNSGVVVVNNDCEQVVVCEPAEEEGACGGEGYVHVRKHSKTAKFDEMNILETYHPATKTYGHMKIEEPKTPFSYYEDADEELESCASQSSKSKLDPTELARKLEESVVGRVEEVVEDEEDDEEEPDDDPESKAARKKFESKRKAHYNEYYAVKLARKLMEQEEDDEDLPDRVEEGGASRSSRTADKFIPKEETEVVQEGIDEDDEPAMGE